MPAKASTVAEYLQSLQPDRRAAVEAVRDVIRRNLDAGYEEGIQYGMIGYYVPHRVYPKGYHCDPRQPLPFAALGAQKNYISLHLMCVYMGEAGDTPAAELARWFREAWAKSGKKLDMGKACIRFKTADDVPLDVIGETFRRVPAAKYIEVMETALAGRKTSQRSSKASAEKSAGKTKGRRPASAKSKKS